MEPLATPTPAQTAETKLKNSFALIILLAGLFVGSLFVDAGQLITGHGFSGSVLKSHDVLESAGKTWVAYTEPAIRVSVVTDADCFDCAPDEALVWMRRILPTLSAQEIQFDSFEGQELVVRHGLRSLPAFVFESGVEQTDFYAEAAPLFTEKDGQYFFDMNKIGLPVGRYLQAPVADAQDIRLGNSNASLTVTLFSDFACEYCQEYHATFTKLVETYGDRVAFVFKHFPLPTHPTAPQAANAASCAHELGAFPAYSDLLFARQDEWSSRENPAALLKSYAYRVQGMDAASFGRCVDSDRHADAVQAGLAAAEAYNLQSAPVTFVGNEVVMGAAPEDELVRLIDEALAQAGGQ